jgi:hypothetical protein
MYKFPYMLSRKKTVLTFIHWCFTAVKVVNVTQSTHHTAIKIHQWVNEAHVSHVTVMCNLQPLKLTFRRWHLNHPCRSVQLGIKCPSHVRNATCQKKIISLSFFKLEPSNKKYFIQNESIYMFKIFHMTQSFFTLFRPVSFRFFPFFKCQVVFSV